MTPLSPTSAPVRDDLPLSAPWRWLRLGGQDLLRQPVPGLFHGLVLTGFGLLLFLGAHDRFWLLAGAFSGFLIVAPVLATGLYEVSRGAAQGRLVRMAQIGQLWASLDGRLVRFGLLLGLAGTGWVLTSAGLITALASQPVLSPADFWRTVVLAREGWLFELWWCLGALLAAPVFASSVVTLPLLLDRPVPVWSAVSTSWSAVAGNPAVMVLWALCIVCLVALGLVTGLLVAVVPWLAHASWHAYVDLCPPDHQDAQA